MQDPIQLYSDNVNNTLVKEILNSLPYTAVLLNKKREIVFSNKVSLDTVHQITIEKFIGKRPGDALNCLHYINNIEDCGKTLYCNFCGITNVILQAQFKKQKQTQESRINRIINGIEYSFELQVTASPFKWDENDFILLTMINISDQSRKRALERIFFHDVLNKTSSLSGFFELIKNNDNATKQRELLEIAETISIDLNEEIISQKELMAAENGELKVKKSSKYTKDIINTIVYQLSNYTIFKDHKIEYNKNCENILVSTDIVLLKRILMNMLKNALEASNINDIITIGCKQTGKRIRFYVHNPRVIDEDVQLQIFQRSFSTKSIDRGLGTYSMKLLGERYLNGKVHFESNELDGTTFNFHLTMEE